MKKTIMCLIDGVRYDALFKINQWVGLPGIFRFIENGTLFTNVYTFEPVLTNYCIGKILTGSTDYTHSKSVFQLLTERNVSNASVGGDMFLSSGATVVYDNLMGIDHDYTPDIYRADIACKIVSDYDFIYVYFVGSDKYAHVCRDAGQHIFSYDSPYIWSIIYEDKCIQQIYDKVISLGITDFNFIVMADHGMTDDGRHSIVNWTHQDVMHVPLIAFGSDFKSNYKENNRFYTTDVIHGIISLYDNNYKGKIFDNVLK